MPVARRSSSNAKQSKLNFATPKGSPAIAGKKAKPSDKKVYKEKSDSVNEVEDHFSSDSNSVDTIEEIEEPECKPAAVSSKRKRGAEVDKREKKLEVKEEGQESDLGTIEHSRSITKQRPNLKVNDVRWRNLAAEAREINDHLPLIHAESENKIHDILRVFDLSYKYGPCYGLSRLDRWERAKAMGLNPPHEIHDILLTRQGVEDPKYAQCVFFDQAERI